MLAGATVVAKALTFAYIFIVMRYLGPELFGKYSLAYSFVAMLSFGSELGLTSFTVREMAAAGPSDPALARRFFSNIFTLRLLLASVTFVAIVGLSFVVTADSAARGAIAIFALAMVLDACAECLSSFFMAFQRMLFPALASIVRAAVVLLGVGLSAWVGWGLGPVVAASAIGGGVAGLGLWAALSWRLWMPRLALHLQYIRTLLWNAMPYIVMSLVTSIFFRIDMVLLSAIKGDLETGLYGAAYRIMESLLFMSIAVNSASLPALSCVLAVANEGGGVVFRRAFGWIVRLGLPMAVGLGLLAAPIMSLFGEGYAAAAPALQVLSAALLLIFVNRLVGTLLTAAGLQPLLMKICAALMAANIVLNLLLIPPYGRMGAAWVTLLCEVALMPVLFMLARRYLALGALLAGLWRPCLAAVVMAAMCWYFGELSLALIVPLGAAVYALMLFGLEFLGAKE